ncbi:hypothetical protein DPMN_099831 [Dreissena polymorpha]|uniref:Uncharacterized protein n=1 Tax=Dreissena polymorpha TaxID=45954 RepID=A0A9D4LES2_DREPO|nr:hypothetical protein DPMN_099831 [Dreissena polymorpha]
MEFLIHVFPSAGFSVLHPEDMAFLFRNVTFMSTLLMASHKLYGPEETNFQHFWCWNVLARNPFYPFRQQLMEVGKKVHAANMDVYEVAVLAALLFMASGM